MHPEGYTSMVVSFLFFGVLLMVLSAPYGWPDRRRWMCRLGFGAGLCFILGSVVLLIFQSTASGNSRAVIFTREDVQVRSSDESGPRRFLHQARCQDKLLFDVVPLGAYRQKAAFCECLASAVEAKRLFRKSRSRQFQA
jgi:hypothetical protein